MLPPRWEEYQGSREVCIPPLSGVEPYVQPSRAVCSGNRPSLLYFNRCVQCCCVVHGAFFPNFPLGLGEHVLKCVTVAFTVQSESAVGVSMLQEMKSVRI